MIRSVIVAGLFIMLSVAGCQEISGPRGEDPEPGERPEQELFDATIHFYQDDRLSGTLQAGRIRKYTKRATVLLDSGVVMEFFNQQGQRTTVLTSDSGRVNETKRDMVATGHVVARSDSGQVLETEELKWDNRLRKIISDVNVTLTTETDTIYGVGFTADEHLQNWQIRQPTGKTFREFERRTLRPGLSLTDSIAPSDSM